MNNIDQPLFSLFWNPKLLCQTNPQATSSMASSPYYSNLFFSSSLFPVIGFFFILLSFFSCTSFFHIYVFFLIFIKKIHFDIWWWPGFGMRNLAASSGNHLLDLAIVTHLFFFCSSHRVRIFIRFAALDLCFFCLVQFPFVIVISLDK